MKKVTIPRPTRQEMIECYQFTKPTIEKLQGRRITFNEFRQKVLAELGTMEMELNEGKMSVCKGCDVFPRAWQFCLGKGRCGNA